jgi:hypothetical protein
MRRPVRSRLLAVSLAVPVLAAACGEGSGAPAITARTPVGDDARLVAAGEGAVWVGQAGGVVVRLDPATGRSTTADVPGLASLAVGAGAAWATGSNGLSRLDPVSGKVTATIPVGGIPRAVAVGEGSVWVVVGDGSLARVDPEANRLDSTIVVGQGLDGLAVGEGAAWATNRDHAELARVDVGTNQIGAVPVGVEPRGVAVGHGSVWVANTVVATVSRIDPGTGRVSATIELSGPPSGIAAGEGAVWVAQEAPKGVVVRIAPETNQVTAKVSIGPSLAAVAVGEGSVWAVQAYPPTLSRIAATPEAAATARAIPTAEPSALLEYRRSGGIAGLLDRLSVDLAIGRAQLKQGIGGPTVFAVPPDTVEALREAAENARLDKLRAVYGRESGADFIVREVSYEGQKVRVVDGPVPERLQLLFSVLESLIDDRDGG